MAPFWKVTVLEDFAELAIVTAATAVYLDPHHCWRL
jgi:hypothetical protein